MEWVIAGCLFAMIVIALYLLRKDEQQWIIEKENFQRNTRKIINKIMDKK